MTVNVLPSISQEYEGPCSQQHCHYLSHKTVLRWEKQPLVQRFMSYFFVFQWEMNRGMAQTNHVSIICHMAISANLSLCDPWSWSGSLKNKHVFFLSPHFCTICQTNDSLRRRLTDRTFVTNNKRESDGHWWRPHNSSQLMLSLAEELATPLLWS